MVNSEASVILVVHNIRSAHNVGSLLRTADGLGIKEVILSGYTPYPKASKEKRLPHIAERVDNQIRKTALGAENFVKWRQIDDLESELDDLKSEGCVILALEQTINSKPLNEFKGTQKLALIVGSEVDGIDSQILKQCDAAVEIPMRGRKESFNVAAAAAMALYHLTLLDR